MSLLQTRLTEIVVERGEKDAEANKIGLLLRRIANSKGEFREKLIETLDPKYVNLIQATESLITEILSNEFMELGMEETNAGILAAFTKISGTISEVEEALADFNLDENAERSVNELKKLAEYLEAYGVIQPVVFDLSMARGLDYYTGVVYEAFDSTGEIVRAIFGGGRYSDLVETLGGTSLSGVGFGMGETVIMELMKLRETYPQEIIKKPDFYVFAVGKDIEVQKRVIEVGQQLKRRFSML